jgi:hypothetical protein
VIDPKFGRSAKRPWLSPGWLKAALVLLLAIVGLTTAWMLHKNAQTERDEQALTLQQIREIGRIAQGNLRAQIQQDASLPFQATRLEGIESRLGSLEDRVRAIEEEAERREGARR